MLGYRLNLVVQFLVDLKALKNWEVEWFTCYFFITWVSCIDLLSSPEIVKGLTLT